MRHDPLEVHQSDPAGCLAGFKAQVIDGLDMPNEAAKVGTLIHAVAERLVAEKNATPMVDVLAVAKDVVRSETLRLGLSPAGVADALAIVETVLSPGSRINLWPDMGWSGAAEVRWGLAWDERAEDFRHVDAPTEPCRAAGTIDLLEWTPGARLVRITDWKTSRQMWGADDAWESFQARLYAFAMLRRFPECESVEFRYGMLRHGYCSTPVDFRRGDPWEWGVRARLQATREQRERAIAAQEWPETPGPWCSYCPVRWTCKRFTAISTMGAAIPPTWSPEEIACALGAARAAARDLEKKARAIVEESQRPIVLSSVTGQALGFKAVNAVECALTYEKTMDRLREFGMTRAQEIEHFRFVAANHFPARVRKVLGEVLRVDRETIDSIVVPIARTEFTVFTPEPELPADRDVSMDELDELVDRALGGA